MSAVGYDHEAGGPSEGKVVFFSNKKMVANEEKQIDCYTQSQMSEKMVRLVPVVKCFKHDIFLKEEEIENK